MAKVKRSNGEGSISYDTTRENYRASITDPNGKRIFKRFKDKEEAEKWLVSTRADIYKGTYIAPSSITLGEWLQQYIEVYCKPNVRLKTYVSYLQTAEHLAPLSKIPLNKLTSHQVQAHLNTLTNLSDSYRNKIHRLLKAALEKAMLTEIIPKNVVLPIKAPKVEKKPVEIFTQEELTAIISYLKQSRHDQYRMYPIVAIALETGMRMGEILGLKIQDLKDSTLHINAGVTDVLGKPTEERPKTVAGRRCVAIAAPLEHLLKQVIAHHATKAPDDYLFRAHSGSPLSTRNIDRSWKIILERANVPYKKFHTLRHTNASMLLGSNVPLLEVVSRLGHSTPSHTLNLYAHAIPGKGKEIAEVASKVFDLGL